VPPRWLTIVAWVSLSVAFVTAAAIAADIFLRGNRQPMKVMEAVWPVTALYFGPLAWWGYTRWGRPSSGGPMQTHRGRVSVAISDLHCGAGCTLGDIIGEWLVFALAASIAGSALVAEYAADFVLAFLLGIAFQYFAIVPMRRLSRRDGLVAALKSDTISIVAFEVGLFGWMALVYLVFFPAPHLSADHAAYWLLMQLGMVLGFATSYPANALLIRTGVKEPM
jgi:hypothetical protein